MQRLPDWLVGHGPCAILLVVIVMAASGTRVAAAAGSATSNVGGQPYRLLSDYHSGALILKADEVPADGIAAVNKPAPLAVGFREPVATTPGKGPYYFVRFVGRAVFAPDARGSWTLHVAINGRDVLQTFLRVSDHRVTATSLAWISGTTRAHASLPAISFAAENYAQTVSVHPGRNTLTMALFRDSGFGFRTLTVLPSSGIGTTDAPPAELALHLSKPNLAVAVGQTAQIHITITNRQNWPDRGVSLDVKGPPGANLKLNRTRFHWQSTGKSRTATITLRGRKVGQYEVEVAVPSQYNEPQRIFGVQVYRPVSGGGGFWWRVLWAVAIAIATAVALGLLRHRWQRTDVENPLSP